MKLALCIYFRAMHQKTKERFYEELKWVDPRSLPSWVMDRCGIQDSFCFRAASQARQLAGQLIDETAVETTSAYEAGYSDDVILKHQNRFLKRWHSDAAMRKQIQRFSLPLYHPLAEEIIRQTLDLPLETKLNHFHVKRAAVAACLTPLRQSVGSCFATAPAIETQQFYIDLFIDDLYELLSRGRLRRVIDGVEYTAPFCLSIGAGDLMKKINPELPFWASPGLIRAFEIGGKISEAASFIEKIHQSEALCRSFYDPGMKVKELILAVLGQEGEENGCRYFKGVVDNALLKIWEFTLASYCDIKMEFSKWNLGWCVGLHPEESGGIGSALHQALTDKLHENHAMTQKKYQEAVVASDQYHAIQARTYQVDSQEELRRLKAEGIGKAHHLQVCQDLYEEAQQKEKITAQMLSLLIQHYTQSFQNYFQEIYDPEFTIEQKSLYEDRQAGFRLVYKHGRGESRLWTAVHDSHQFIAVLEEFFRAVEPSIADLCSEPYEKELVSEMTTVILQLLRTKEFLETALKRAQKQGRLPWAYSSGGTVEQIASIFCRHRSSLRHEKRFIQDELDLFTFMIETLKGLPPSSTNRFMQEPDQGLLFQSPTHVCLLLPGAPAFLDAWNDRGFTYTWIRDRWMIPARDFYLGQTFSRDEQRELYRRMGIEGDVKLSMTIEEFAKQIKHIPIDAIASFLFQTLPLTPAKQCQALLHPSVWNRVQETLPPFVSSQELFHLMRSAQDDFYSVRENMRQLKLASPVFLFADTNWSNGYFSFVLHPVTLKLEVWKTDWAGVCGSPLPLVKSWLEHEWLIYF